MLARFHFPERPRGLDHFQPRRSVLAVRAAIDGPSHQLGHELQPVTDAEDRHDQLEDLRIDHRRAGLLDAVGAAGEDDALAPEGADLLERHRAGMELAIDVQLADPSGDQLRVLRPEVEDQDLFCMDVGHPALQEAAQCSGKPAGAATSYGAIRTGSAYSAPPPPMSVARALDSRF